MVCMFSHKTKAFPSRQASAASVAKIPIRKDHPYLENFSDYTVSWNPFTDQTL